MHLINFRENSLFQTMLGRIGRCVIKPEREGPVGFLLARNRSTSSGVAFQEIAASSSQPYGVYIHWPYCARKCTYCNFNKYVSNNVDDDR